MPDPKTPQAATNDFLKQAVAAQWSLSQLSAQEWNNLCQQFIENAYGTTGRYPTATAASKALFKSRNLSQAKPGALVFFAADPSNGQAGHAGIYLGADQMISATPSGVKITQVTSDPYYKNLFVGWGDAPPDWKGRNVGKDILAGATQLVDKLVRATASTAEASPALNEGTSPVTTFDPAQSHEYRGPLPETPTAPIPDEPKPPTTLELARKNLEDLNKAITALENAPPGSYEAVTVAPTELPRLRTARTSAIGQIERIENNLRDDELRASSTASRPPETKIRGDREVEWDPKTRTWIDVGEAPPDKPADPSLVASRGAQQQRDEAGARLTAKQIEKLELDIETARIAQERLAPLQAALEAASALPDGPEKTNALKAATRGILAISDPDKFNTIIRQEAVDALAAQREEREAQEFQATQAQREIDNKRNAETAARQEREGVATGVRDLLKLENERAQTAAQTRTQHMKSGFGSLRDSPEFQRMQQSLDPQMAAQAVGMDPNSLKFKAIWDSWNQRGQMQSDAQPPQMPGQPQGQPSQERFEDRGQGMGEYFNAQGVSQGLSDIQEPGGNIQAAALRPAILQNLQPAPPAAEEENPLDAIQNRTPIAALLESVHQAV